MRTPILLLVMLVALLTGCTNTTDPVVMGAQKIEPIVLDGTWLSTDKDIVMSAEVVDETIKIFWQAEDVKGLYWAGDFDTPTSVKDGELISSTADRAELDMSIFGSGAKSKTFKYDDNQLSFDFEAMGVSKTIHLKRT